MTLSKRKGIFLFLFIFSWFFFWPAGIEQARAAITVIDKESNSVNPATSLTINKPTGGGGIQNEDVLVAFITQQQENPISGPAGWTEDSQVNTTAGRDMSSGIWYKVITDASGEPASYTWTGINEQWGGGILVLRGVDNTTPIDQTTVSRTGQDWDETTDYCGSITTVTDGALVLACAFLTHVNVTAGTQPGGTDKQWETIEANANTFCATYTQASADATGNKQWTTTGENNLEEWHTWQAAFRPAIDAAVLANPATQVTDQLGETDGSQPADVELVGFKITPTGTLTWTDLVVSLTYGGGMADADITNAQIYVDNGTVGTYDVGADTPVGSQSVNASSGSLTWDTVGGTITAATNYLIIFDAGATLSDGETVQASVTAANITITGVTTSGSVSNEPLHTVTVFSSEYIYQVEDGDSDCETETGYTAYVEREFVSSLGTCAKGEKYSATQTGAQNMVLGYLGNGGYASDMTITLLDTGNNVVMKSKNTDATGYIYLVEVDPSDLSTTTLDTYSFDMDANSAVTITDLSMLTGTVESQMTFGILVSITPVGSSKLETNWGDSDTAAKQIKINVDITADPDPLTGVSNSPSPNTPSDTSTHTVSFTTADPLPADGKIEVTFPAGFDLTAVGNTDISSSTMDGSFTVGVSRSGQVLTITRSGGTEQSAAAEDIIIADIANTSTSGTTYTVTVETQNSAGERINGATTSSAFTIINCDTALFGYRKTLVIDYTKVGTDNSGTLPATGVPVLVSLSGNWLKTTTVDAVNGRIESADGYDIVFREGPGTRNDGLYHEIEEYDGTGLGEDRLPFQGRRHRHLHVLRQRMRCLAHRGPGKRVG